MKRTNQHITKLYLKMVEDNSEPVAGDRTNCYTCPNCKHVTKTIDVDNGVTPFMHSCEKCGEMARSCFYRNIHPDMKPTQEWYRPSLDEVLKWHKKNKHSIVEHILQGGLTDRKIKTAQ